MLLLTHAITRRRFNWSWFVKADPGHLWNCCEICTKLPIHGIEIGYLIHVYIDLYCRVYGLVLLDYSICLDQGQVRKYALSVATVYFILPVVSVSNFQCNWCRSIIILPKYIMLLIMVTLVIRVRSHHKMSVVYRDWDQENYGNHVTYQKCPLRYHCGRGFQTQSITTKYNFIGVAAVMIYRSIWVPEQVLMMILKKNII